MLQAQSTYLQQHDDALGAALLASYVPDHQAQASLIAARITAMGGNPAGVAANIQPTLGTRAEIIAFDLKAHRQAIQNYTRLARETAGQAKLHALALNGLGAAMRHFVSLRVAEASALRTPAAKQSAMRGLYILEITAANDLRTQIARLRTLGDAKLAAQLQPQIAKHRRAAAQMAYFLRQYGGDMRPVMLPPTVPHASRSAIIEHLRVEGTQITSTYALPIASTPPGPLHTALTQAQDVSKALLELLPAATTASPPAG